MPDISQINVGGIVYDVKDQAARTGKQDAIPGTEGQILRYTADNTLASENLTFRNLTGTQENPLNLDLVTQPGVYILDTPYFTNHNFLSQFWGNQVSVSWSLQSGMCTQILAGHFSRRAPFNNDDQDVITVDTTAWSDWVSIPDIAIYEESILTLEPGTWVGDTAPYTYTLNNVGIYGNFQLDVGLAETTTDEEYEVAVMARLFATKSANSKLLIKAYGEKPAIPLSIKVRSFAGGPNSGVLSSFPDYNTNAEPSGTAQNVTASHNTDAAAHSALFAGTLSAPTPTAADNGKFLRVVNGAAAWATVPSAEGGSF